MPGEKARGPSPVPQCLSRLRGKTGFPGAAFAGDEARARCPRAAFGPVEDFAQIVVAAVERLDKTIVPAQKAEEVRLAVLESVRKREPFEARLGDDLLRNAERRRLKQERAIADEDVRRGDEVAAGNRRPKLNPNDRGRSLGLTRYRFDFPTLTSRAVKSPVVLTSSARNPAPWETLIPSN